MALIVKSFDTALEFVAALRPDVSRARQQHALVYRGQEDATWGLVPSGFRKDTRFPTHDGWWTIDEYVRRSPPGMDRDRSKWAARLERATLRVFFDTSDDAGLPLPEDSQAIRALLDGGGETWPDVALLSILALAQHHGVPTRLFDWSWDWRVAAFFAASGSLRMNCDVPLAVWSLDVDELRYQDVPGLRESPKESRRFRLRLVTAPAATNSNLRAQKGLFTLLDVVDNASMDPWTPLDHLADNGKLGGHALELVKYTLPASEARTLMHQLYLECMTAAVLFPGYGGVVQSLRDRALWDPRPDGRLVSAAAGL